MDEKPNSDNQSPNDEGEPVAALALIVLEASPGFWTRVRRKIDRRVTTAQVLSFSWNLPKVVFLEFLQMAFNVFSPAKGREGESR
jgi:hypothetical protein